MALVIQRQNLTTTVNELKINTCLEGSLRPQEMHLSPTTSTSDKTNVRKYLKLANRLFDFRSLLKIFLIRLHLTGSKRWTKK